MPKYLHSDRLLGIPAGREPCSRRSHGRRRFSHPWTFWFISQQLGSTPNLVKNLCLPLEPKDVKGFVHDLHLLDIVDGLHLDLAQAAGRIVCAKGECQTKSNCQTRHVQRLTFRFGNISVSRLLPFFLGFRLGEFGLGKSLGFRKFGLEKTVSVLKILACHSVVTSRQIVKQSQIIKQSQIANKFSP